MEDSQKKKILQNNTEESSSSVGLKEQTTPQKNIEEESSLSLSQKNQTSPQQIRTQTGITKIIDEDDTLVMRVQSNKESPASLLLLNGPEDLIGFSWTLRNMVTSVGRSRRLNDINISYKSLSKTHFQILNERGKFYIVDLQSTNKTYVNDEELEPYQKIPLKNNSYIRASHVIFKFLDKGNIEAFSSKQILSTAQTDPLTGANNRQLLKSAGPEYFSSNKNLSLIVFDIDNFKSINDNFGHTAGDHILKNVAKCVMETVRIGDLFIRYGGDEFCLFTPIPISIAKYIAKRIQSKVKNQDFLFEGQKIPVDISIGVAEKSAGDTMWEDIYKRADKKSYEQKKTKKNQAKPE